MEGDFGTGLCKTNLESVCLFTRRFFCSLGATCQETNLLNSLLSFLRHWFRLRLSRNNLRTEAEMTVASKSDIREMGSGPDAGQTIRPSSYSAKETESLAYTFHLGRARKNWREKVFA